MYFVAHEIALTKYLCILDEMSVWHLTFVFFYSMFRFALKLVRRQQFWNHFCFRFVFYEKIIIQLMYYQIIVRTDFCIINILINQWHWLNANSSMSAFACSPGQANGAPAPQTRRQKIWNPNLDFARVILEWNVL